METNTSAVENVVPVTTGASAINSSAVQQDTADVSTAQGLEQTFVSYFFSVAMIDLSFCAVVHQALPENITVEMKDPFLPDDSNKEQVGTAAPTMEENKSMAEDEDDLVDIDGQDGLEPTMKAADELKAAIGQGQGNIEILEREPDFANGGSGKEVNSIPPDEEEEDIDIVEVDEEEEAKVKQAMGVGEGIPAVHEDYAQVGFDSAQRDLLSKGSSGLDRVLTEAQGVVGSGGSLSDIAQNSVFDGSLKGKRGVRTKRKIGTSVVEEEIVDTSIHPLGLTFISLPFSPHVLVFSFRV